MQLRTRHFFATAEENQEVARAILAIEQPGMTRWAVVAAFYTAVQDVNGYLWEVLRVEPRTHEDRLAMIATVSTLRNVRQPYSRLQSNAFYARYRPRFQISRADAGVLIEQDLMIVRATIARVLPSDS